MAYVTKAASRSVPGVPARGPAIDRRTFVATAAAALASAPGFARAQAPGKTYRIAVWNIAYPLADIAEDGALRYRAFFQELRRLGFVEGRNLTVERYSGEGRTDRYAQIAREIVDSRPDVIVPNGPVAARLLVNLTSTIPLVTTALGDPIASGLAASLARPGRNLTGFTIDGGVEFEGRRLQLAKEAAPDAGRLGYLATRGLLTDQVAEILRQAASRLDVELVMKAMDGTFGEAAYRAAFDELARQRVEGLYVSAAAEHFTHRKVIIGMVAAAKLPAIYSWREFADDGGLMAYGADSADNYRKSAGYVARILNGEKPGDLPIQQPTKFEFVVNLKTAKALGIVVLQPLLIQATEVIE